MGAPANLVHLQKTEFASTGGDAADESPYQEVLEHWEDAPAVQGLFLQAPGTPAAVDKLVWVSRDASGNMIFRDNVDMTERTLTELISGSSTVDYAWRRQFLLMGC